MNTRKIVFTTTISVIDIFIWHCLLYEAYVIDPKAITHCIDQSDRIPLPFWPPCVLNRFAEEGNTHQILSNAKNFYCETYFWQSNSFPLLYYCVKQQWNINEVKEDVWETFRPEKCTKCALVLDRRWKMKKQRIEFKPHVLHRVIYEVSDVILRVWIDIFFLPSFDMRSFSAYTIWTFQSQLMPAYWERQIPFSNKR